VSKSNDDAFTGIHHHLVGDSGCAQNLYYLLVVTSTTGFFFFCVADRGSGPLLFFCGYMR
jgi:hypothetical protein